MSPRHRLQLTNHFAGFLAGGRFFTNLPKEQTYKAPKHAVHESLRQKALDWIEDEKQCTKEALQIRQGVYQLLQHCKTDQDIRDALPEAVVGFFPDLKALPRTRSEAWPIQHSPLLLHSWDVVSSTIFTRFSSALLN